MNILSTKTKTCVSIPLLAATSSFILATYIYMSKFDNVIGALGKEIHYNVVKSESYTTKRFQSRLDLLNARCEPSLLNSVKRKQWVDNRFFITIPEKRVVVCVTGKCGSTNWRELAWKFYRVKINEESKPYHYTHLKQLRQIMPQLKESYRNELMHENRNEDNDVTKVVMTGQNHRLILVRHPFGRLISAWHEKFRFSSNYGMTWLWKDFTLRSYKKENDPQHNMAFVDFAQYIAEVGHENNEHFMPVSSMCEVCEVAYTYIVKTETLDEDALWLMQRLNITEYELLHRNIPLEGSLVNKNPHEAIGRMMSKLPNETIEKLYNLYKNDFYMFGYTYDINLQEAGGF